MKKTPRVAMPRRVVLPLAAAALLTACDERPPGAYKSTHASPMKSGTAVPAKSRTVSARSADGIARRHV
jgi:hypothetical protein